MPMGNVIARVAHWPASIAVHLTQSIMSVVHIGTILVAPMGNVIGRVAQWPTPTAVRLTPSLMLAVSC